MTPFFLGFAFALGVCHCLACWCLTRGGMHPTAVAVVLIAGPVVALYLGFTY